MLPVDHAVAKRADDLPLVGISTLTDCSFIGIDF
jgi:hypothetical protein